MPTVAAEIRSLVWEALGLRSTDELDHLNQEAFEEIIQAALDTGDYPSLSGEKRP